MYDGVDYRYHHADSAPDAGRKVAARVLGLTEPPAGELLYDLHLYSGGSGVLNRLAITLAADPGLWTRIAESARARTPDEAQADQSWEQELVWLLTKTEPEEPVEIVPAAVEFINAQRREFQTECTAASRILFGQESNVNDWIVLWGDDGRLNYLEYSQG